MCLCMYVAMSENRFLRSSPFLQFPEYVDNFFPLCDQLEQEGKWKKEQITTFSRSKLFNFRKYAIHLSRFSFMTAKC
jgi:hypothetical protein